MSFFSFHKNIKRFLVALLVFADVHCIAQVAFSLIPKDSTLVARNLQTNTGTINIKGTVNNANTQFDSLSLALYRGNKLVNTVYEGLAYNGSIASFSLQCQIPAELIEYKIAVNGITRSVQTPVVTVNGLVAGDVFMIEGQSNAFSMMRDGSSANSNKSEFIRVFGNSDSSTNGLLKNLKWFTGEGDGGLKENGHVGQWGLRFGRLLVDSVKIPVAIFNGACGGTPISYYQVPADYKNNFKSNYVREYNRLKMAGVEKNVRAIIWSQGETDAERGTSTANYISAFEAILKTWSIDYPGRKRIYIFQTRNNNMYSLDKLMAIEEAQRQLAVKHDTDIEIIPTSTLMKDKSELHFRYKGGYEIFGNRIYSLIARDLYVIKPKGEIDAPMITSAYMADSTTLVVTEGAKLLMPHDAKLPIQGYEIGNGGSSKVDTVIISGNKIVFLLSRYPGVKATVSCFSQYKQVVNWVTNSSGIETLCFNKYPIADSIKKQNSIVKKSSNVKLKHGLFAKTSTIVISKTGKYNLVVYNSKKKKPQWITFTGKRYKLETDKMTKGQYYIHVFDSEMKMVGSISFSVE